MFINWIKLLFYKPFTFNDDKYMSLLKHSIIKNDLKLFKSILYRVKKSNIKESHYESLRMILTNGLFRDDILDYLLPLVDLYNHQINGLIASSISNYYSLDTYKKVLNSNNLYLNISIFKIIETLIRKMTSSDKYMKDECINEIYRLYDNVDNQISLEFYLHKIIEDLVYFKNYDILKYIIINNKIPINDRILNHCLLDICKSNKLDIFKLFIDKLSNFEYINKFELLENCILNNSFNIFKFLIDKFDFVNNNDFNYVLYTSVGYYNIKFIEHLLSITNKPSDKKNRCLNLAIMNKNIEVIMLFLNNKYINFNNIDNPNDLIILLYENKYIDILNKLLNDVNILKKINKDIKNKFVPNYESKKIKRQLYE